MGPAIRRYAVLVGWRDPASAEPHAMIDSQIRPVMAVNAAQAIDTALSEAAPPETSPLAEVASVHLLSPSEEAEIAGMTAR